MSWNHKGYEINVDSGGLFSAVVDEVTVTADSLEGIKHQIENETREVLKKRSLNLKVIAVITQLRDWRHKPEKEEPNKIHGFTLTGVNRTTADLQFAEKPPQGWGLASRHSSLNPVLPDTPANRDTLQDYLNVCEREAKLRAWMEEHRLTSGTFGRIEAARYNEILKRIEERYRKTAAVPKRPAEKKAGAK